LQEGAAARVVVVPQRLVGQVYQALTPNELFHAFAGLHARGVSVVNLAKLLPMNDASMARYILEIARAIGGLNTPQLTPAALHWLTHLPKAGKVGFELLDSLARAACPMVAFQSVKTLLENNQPLDSRVIRRLQQANETLYLLYALLKQHGQANAYFNPADLDPKRLIQSQFTAWLMGQEGTYALTVEWLGTVPNTEVKDQVYCLFRYKKTIPGAYWQTGCSGPHPENGVVSEPILQKTVAINPEGKSIREIKKWFGL
jgi:hypothetical protein